jgi:hypothetical protein
MNIKNQLRFLFALAALAVPFVVHAVPADPRPFPFHQPDGTEIALRVRGDEWFHWYETPEGRPVILDAASDENSKRRQISHRCLRGGAFFAQDLRARTLLLASRRESDLKHHYPTSAILLPNQTTSCL